MKQKQKAYKQTVSGRQQRLHSHYYYRNVKIHLGVRCPEDLFNPCVKVRSRGSSDMEASFWVHMKQFCPGAQRDDHLWLSILLSVVRHRAGHKSMAHSCPQWDLAFLPGEEGSSFAARRVLVCSHLWPLVSCLLFKGPCPARFSLTFRALRNPCLRGVFTYSSASAPVIRVWVSDIHSPIICANDSFLAECREKRLHSPHLSNAGCLQRGSW